MQKQRKNKQSQSFYKVYVPKNEDQKEEKTWDNVKLITFIKFETFNIILKFIRMLISLNQSGARTPHEDKPINIPDMAEIKIEIIMTFNM